MEGPQVCFQRLTHAHSKRPIAYDWAAPAGLDVGADGAEQVATSIVAEILAVLHGRTGASLRSLAGPIHS